MPLLTQRAWLPPSRLRIADKSDTHRRRRVPKHRSRGLVFGPFRVSLSTKSTARRRLRPATLDAQLRTVARTYRDLARPTPRW